MLHYFKFDKKNNKILCYSIKDFINYSTLHNIWDILSNNKTLYKQLWKIVYQFIDMYQITEPWNNTTKKNSLKRTGKKRKKPKHFQQPKPKKQRTKR